MSAEIIAAALGGRKVASGWVACCPAHDDRIPSLSIKQTSDGKVLIHCHAGCSQGEVIAILRARALWTDNPRHKLVASGQQTRLLQATVGPDAHKRTAALQLWEATQPAAGTLVETYMRVRGLELVPPRAIRFHPGLRHPSGSLWPAMVGLVTQGADDHPLAVHRTFLARDGSGKAPVEQPKMMLGPCRGGAVHLAPHKNLLMVGEGIETCLSAMQATALPAWAALSTSGLRALDLPQGVQEVIILADADEPGEAAAMAAALRWKSEGRRVRIARPPQGLDFNDILIGRGLVNKARVA